MRKNAFVGRLLAACVLLMPGVTLADTITVSCSSGGGCPVTIPNTLPVSSVDSTVNEATTGTIIDVNVFVDIDYLSLQNLTIELVHLVGMPGETVVELFDQVISPDPFNRTFEVTFDDQAADPIDLEEAPFVGTFQPVTGPLSAFNGMELAGDWTLRVKPQTFVSLFNGTIDDWYATIEFNPSGGGSAPVPGTLALMGGALLVGAGFRRRRRAAVKA